jgi:hypothetical protein
LKGIVALFRDLRENFLPSDLDQFCGFAASVAFNQIDAIPLRDIDDRDFDNFFEILESMSTRAFRPQIVHFQFEFALKLAKSEILTKQISGLATINKLMSDHYIFAKDVVSLLDQLLSNDLHHELVPDVSTMLGRVIRQLKSEQLNLFRKFWILTANNLQTTITVFLQGVQRLLTYIGPQYFFETVITVSEYPDAVLYFMKQHSNWLDIPEHQGRVFSALLEFFRANDETMPIARKELLASTMQSFCPREDPQFMLKIQDVCFDLITKDTFLEFAYPVLGTAVSRMEPEKADEYFELFLSRMNENTVKHLELFVQVMRRMSNQLTE